MLDATMRSGLRQLAKRNAATDRLLSPSPVYQRRVESRASAQVRLHYSTSRENATLDEFAGCFHHLRGVVNQEIDRLFERYYRSLLNASAGKHFSCQVDNGSENEGAECAESDAPTTRFNRKHERPAVTEHADVLRIKLRSM